MSWSTVHLEVTTPLFNAGHDPDGADQAGRDATGVRVPSVLGAMRFWFRALAGAHLGPDLAALHEWEGRVFGRAGDDANGDRAASPLQWRIPRQPPVTPATTKPAWLPSYGAARTKDQGADRWIVYLLGQGLGDLRNCRVSRPYVSPGERFELRFRPRRDDPAAVSLALTSLWLTCAFGGVGARTRRGFGGLRITGFEPGGLALPPPWDTLDLAAPTDHVYGRASGLIAEPVGKTLPLLRRDPTARPLHAWSGPPPYPVLGGSAKYSGHDIVASGLGSADFGSWDRALRDAGEGWRLSRATVEVPGAQYHPPYKTPEYLDVVHGQDDRFALGALGLPVVFKGAQVNLMDGSDHLRRASPLWLRPVRIGDRWKVFSFVFLSDLLPTGPGAPQVKLLGGSGPRTLTIHQTDLTDWWTTWMEDQCPPTE